MSRKKNLVNYCSLCLKWRFGNAVKVLILQKKKKKKKKGGGALRILFERKKAKKKFNSAPGPFSGKRTK
jgi:hypothetical protein